MIFFGQHCKGLKELELSAAVDFSELTRVGSPNLFPALEMLNIEQNEPSFVTESMSQGEIDRLAKQTLKIMPHCGGFRSGYDYGENPFDNAVSYCSIPLD